MKYDNIGTARTLDEYVDRKYKAFCNAEHTFSSLYSMLFSDENNVIFEKNDGYKIKKITYGECKKTSERYAYAIKNILKDQRSGETVALYFDNSAEWIELFWAILNAGFNILLLNLRLDDGTIEKTLDEMNVVAVVSNGKVFKKKTVFLSDLALTDSALLSDEFGDTVFIMSSGTSKNVKVSAYGAEEFFVSLANCVEGLKQNDAIKKHYEGQLKLLVFLPFYHIFGLFALYFWFAMFSRTFVLLNDLSPDTILGTIRRNKVTHILAVPLFWNTVYGEAIKTIKQRGEATFEKFNKGLNIAKKLGSGFLGRTFSRIAFKEVRENLFGESVSFMITGGSMIDPKVIEFFNGIGYRLSNGYGMTEIGIASVELSNDVKVINTGTVGKPFSTTTFKIEDGQLLVKGKGVAKYVLEKGQKIERDEWFKTGDLAKEINGRYYLLGRKDDLIITATGENLNPNIIESKFDFPDIRGVALIKTNESFPVLLVSVKRYISAESIEKVQNYLKNRMSQLNLNGMIGSVQLIGDPLIKGEEIKLDRRRLAIDFSDGKLHSVVKACDENEEWNEIEIKVRELFAIALSKEEGDLSLKSDFFTDEGGTSLDYLAMTAAIKREFGVDVISDGKLTSIEAIADFIKRNI